MSTRLLIIGQAASPVGGVQTLTDQIFLAAKTHGYTPIICLIKSSSTHIPEKYIEYHPQLTFDIIDGRGLDFHGRVRLVKKYIKKYSPDMVLPINVAEAQEACCQLKSEQIDIKFISTIQGNLVNQFLDMHRLEPYIDMCVCPGKLTCRVVEFIGLNSERIQHIPNAAQKALNATVPKKLKQKIQIAYVGRLNSGEKRAQDILKLLPLIKNSEFNVHFHIVGSGTLDKEIAQKVSEEGMNKQVTLWGAVDSETLYNKIYPNLDFVFLFSESEAFGITLLEAMMHGIPCITSDYIGRKSEGFAIKDETCLTYKTGDMDAAYHELKKAINSTELYEKISLQSYEKATKEYSWEICRSNWAKLLNDLSSGACRQSPPLMPLTAENSGTLGKLGLPPSIIDCIRKLKFKAGLSSSVRNEWCFVLPNQKTDKSDTIKEQLKLLDTP